MKTDQPPQLVCRRLPAFDSGNWESVAQMFNGTQPCSLRQTWLPQLQESFRPAVVRTGWTDTALWVYAELDDDDIFNPITEFNAPSFRSGDVFEMFLRPIEQPAYYEFHVTPQNQKLQLRIPSAEEFGKPRKDPGIPPDWFVAHRVIDSRAEIRAERRQWRVLAAIPFDLVAEHQVPRAGSQWLFSFSRYDYTRGQAQPVLSSTSPHVQVNFHRQQEWGTLTFQ